MTTINELLLSMRYELKDISEEVYSPYVLMDQYNKANKLIRQTIINNFPMQLAEEVTGIVNPGELITLPKNPIKFIDFRVNDKKQEKISLAEIPDKAATGEPKAYYLANINTARLYPSPDKQCSYEITYIPETETKTENQDSGYQTDVEQLLIRYVVATLTGSGFDLVAEYNNTIGKLLGSIETGTTVVDGYW